MANWSDPNLYRGANSAKWNTDWGKEAYNARPYEAYTQQQQNWKNQYLSGNSPLGEYARGIGNQIAGLGNQYGGFNRWGAGYAAPNDPTVKGYMSNLGSGRGAMLSDVARRFAGASVASNRGGYGVTGGWSPDQSARRDAMDTLSRGYSDDYSKAMDWTGKLYGGLTDAWRTGIDAQARALEAQANTGVALGNQQLQGLKYGTDYATDMLGRRASDWDKDVEYDRSGWAREQAMLKAQFERQQQQEAIRQAANRQQLLNQAIPLWGPNQELNWVERLRAEAGNPAWGGQTGKGVAPGVQGHYGDDDVRSLGANINWLRYI